MLNRIIDGALNLLACICLLPMLIAISLCDRVQAKKGTARKLAEPAAQEGEPPHLPPTIIVHLAIGDREAGRAKHDKDFAEARARWATQMEIERMIYEIEEGA